MSNKELIGATASVFAVVVSLLFLVALISNTSKPVSVDTTCDQKYDEFVSVARIATATGKLPGVVGSLPVGSKLSVNPNMCGPK